MHSRRHGPEPARFRSEVAASVLRRDARRVEITDRSACHRPSGRSTREVLLDEPEVAAAASPHRYRSGDVVEPGRVEPDEQLETRVRTVYEAVEDREVESIVECERRRARVEPHLPHALGLDRAAGHRV